jgi:histidyl-tRNA synthetase
VDEKGISNETADAIGNLVKTRGHPLEVLKELRKTGSKFMENEGSVVALKELDILFQALEKANAVDKIVFDLSLARGLDYYTGVIYEAVFKGTTQVRHVCLPFQIMCSFITIICTKKAPFESPARKTMEIVVV